MKDKIKIKEEMRFGGRLLSFSSEFFYFCVFKIFLMMTIACMVAQI